MPTFKTLWSAVVCLFVVVALASFVLFWTDWLGPLNSATLTERSALVAALATALTLVAASAAAVGAFHIGSQQLTHQVRETAARGLLDLTSGEVAQARDVIGRLLYSDRDTTLSSAQLTSAYFTIIWALERSGSAWSAVKTRTHVANETKQSWAWHLQELTWNVWLIGAVSNTLDARQKGSGLGLDDDNARQRLGQVLKELAPHVQLQRGKSRTRWEFLTGQTPIFIELHSVYLWLVHADPWSRTDGIKALARLRNPNLGDISSVSDKTSTIATNLYALEQINTLEQKLTKLSAPQIADDRAETQSLGAAQPRWSFGMHHWGDPTR